MKRSTIRASVTTVLVVLGGLAAPISLAAPPLHPYDDGVYTPLPAPDKTRCLNANVSTPQREKFCRTIPFLHGSPPGKTRANCWSKSLTGGTDWDNWCSGVSW